MNTTLKTVLLTVLTLSVFTLAMIEVSGVSTTAIVNKYKGIDDSGATERDPKKEEALEKEVALLPKTSFTVSDTLVDLGTIIEGEKRTAVYYIKNTGTNPLRISNVHVSCGCTAPQFPKYAIAPGDSAAIELVFNSAGKSGEVTKSAMVRSNSDMEMYPIKFKGVVKPKPTS
jgi:hypothetical protein